jgi:acetyl-CoA acetyltransferase
MNQAFLCDGLRTPIARSGGPLSAFTAGDLAALVLRGLSRRQARVDWGALDDLVLGASSREGLWNLALSEALEAALPARAQALLVHRSSGSGLEAVSVAARAVKAGEADLVVAVGAESSSERSDRSPAVDHLGARIGVARADQDRFALRSQQRWARAQAAGRFQGEVLAVPLVDRRGGLFDTDEPPRPETTLEALARLAALGPPGQGVTAGNSAGLGVHDGACALLLASERAAARSELVPVARIVATAAATARPRALRSGVAPAVQHLLERAGIWLQDVSVIEIDESYASDALAVLRELRLPDDAEHVNPNGGAIAMGDPAAMTGARLVLSAARELARRGGRYALCATAIRFDQGIAMLLERV